MDEQYGKLYGIEPGDSPELSLCQIKYKSDDGSFQFLPLGRASLKVIGTYRNSRQLSEVLLSASLKRESFMRSSVSPAVENPLYYLSWQALESLSGAECWQMGRISAR